MKIAIAAVVALVAAYFAFPEQRKKLLEKTQVDEQIGEAIGDLRDTRKLIQLRNACELIDGFVDEDSKDEWAEMKKTIAAKAFEK